MTLGSPARRHALLAAFWVCAVAQVLAIELDLTAIRWVTKAALVPLLLAWVVMVSRGPRLLVAALVASTAGDVLLETGRLLPGMAMFGVAHLCFVGIFLPRRTDSRRADRRRGVLAAYGVVWLGLVTLLWPGLGDLRIPVAVYALLLTATAVTSCWYGARTGLGGAIFLVSDALIAVGLAGHDFPLRGALVMSTYAVAQYLLASGVISRSAPGSRSGSPAGSGSGSSRTTT